ncbi:MAG: CHAP domain-containing protein [Oscillospiraceae bacterium]|jgi:hypothetical protein|nr:CHAP domain-containing protein [Oscillospiraceae bacterium]
MTRRAYRWISRILAAILLLTVVSLPSSRAEEASAQPESIEGIAEVVALDEILGTEETDEITGTEGTIEIGESYEASPEPLEEGAPDSTGDAFTAVLETSKPATEEAEPASEGEDVQTDTVVAEPVEVEPVAAEPTEEEPVAAEPTEEEPAAAESTEEEPVAAESTEEGPVVAESTEEEPVVAESTEAEPAAAESVNVEPTKRVRAALQIEEAGQSDATEAAIKDDPSEQSDKAAASVALEEADASDGADKATGDGGTEETSPADGGTEETSPADDGTEEDEASAAKGGTSFFIDDDNLVTIGNSSNAAPPSYENIEKKTYAVIPGIEAPVLSTVVGGTELTWSGDDYGYYVLRRLSEEMQYQLFDTIFGNGLSEFSKNYMHVYNTVNYYSIVSAFPYRGVSEPSNVVDILMQYLGTPTLSVDVKDDASDAIDFQWSAAVNRSQYITNHFVEYTLYAATAEDGDYQEIQTTTRLNELGSISELGLQPGETYYFYVQAWQQVEDFDPFYAKKSNVVSLTVPGTTSSAPIDKPDVPSTNPNPGNASPPIDSLPDLESMLPWPVPKELPQLIPGVTIPKTPASVWQTKDDAGRSILRWNAVNDADGYIVYIVEADGSMTQCFHVENGTGVVLDASFNGKTLMVTSFWKRDGQMVTSFASDKIKIKGAKNPSTGSAGMVVYPVPSVVEWGQTIVSTPTVPTVEVEPDWDSFGKYWSVVRKPIESGLKADGTLLQTQENAVEWARRLKDTYGELGIDYDHEPMTKQTQCVDLIQLYLAQFLGLPTIAGNANQYAGVQRDGLSWIPYEDGFVAEPGDIVIWSTTPYAVENGHIAIVTSANEQTFTCIDQNYGEGDEIREKSPMAYDRAGWILAGVLRPKFSK